MPIAPSTLDHKVEPVWWAELRQLQTFITGYIDESRTNVDKAINTVDSVHKTLKTAVTDAARHESVAGAYSRQAQSAADTAHQARILHSPTGKRYRITVDDYGNLDTERITQDPGPEP